MLTIELENNIYQMPEKIFLISAESSLGLTDHLFKIVYYVTIQIADNRPYFLLQMEPNNYIGINVYPEEVVGLNYIDYTRFQNIKAFA